MPVAQPWFDVISIATWLSGGRMTLATQLIPQHGNGETAASSSLDELSIGDAIRQCPFFDVFSRDLQATIANYLELFTVVAGDKLFAKGD